MINKELQPNDIDAICVAIEKLHVVKDFMSMFDSDVLHPKTPEGIALIVGECISILNNVGGFNERQTK